MTRVRREWGRGRREVPKLSITLPALTLVGLLSQASPSTVLAQDDTPAESESTTEASETSADDAEAPADDVENLVVTGSYIPRKRQLDQPTPIAIISGAQIDEIGAKRIADITRTLTINTGAENNIDAFTQNATQGTSNINLRGLGVGSTLVLLNGKRQTTIASQNNQGITFVDTSAL
ncbi:MAG: TonB-dependent receptor plug domain-containing protein, partial [Myxococcota bacterium]